MDWELFRDILSIDSTSGKERALSEFLAARLLAPALERQEVGDGTENLFLKWGTPRVVFCSHMDTVPPYIPPTFGDGIVRGRGTCDAKGQIFALYTACRRLAEAGCRDFGLLLVSGEETGSWGAKAFARTPFRAPYLIIGEPTENKMVTASKGTKSFDLVFTGKPFHSGYPAFGVSAVDLFVDFVERLRAVDFGEDPLLGATTWNIGQLRSDNPQNILSPEASCRLYFRTTFVSDEAVCAWMAEAPSLVPGLSVTPRGGDTPARYWTAEGIPSGPASFGSDAPHLVNFTHRAICGPGTIRVAHRPDEHICVEDLEKAVEQYMAIYRQITA